MTKKTRSPSRRSPSPSRRSPSKRSPSKRSASKRSASRRSPSRRSPCFRSSTAQVYEKGQRVFYTKPKEGTITKVEYDTNPPGYEITLDNGSIINTEGEFLTPITTTYSSKGDGLRFTLT